MKSQQNKYLHQEFWVLTFGAAFQHANIYKSGVVDKDRANFKFMLRGYIENTIVPQYKKAVNEEQHIANLISVVSYSENFHKILQNGKINIGVAQKLLNLFFKYLWCINEIKTPPHFPVDRLIQKNAIKNQPIISWTKMTKVETYMQIINQAREIAKEQHLSLASWELDNYRRSEP
ncbi:MAG: hypothetical protein HQ521_18885 [Bacteroidetes bacterium]|nr:hypothetical protein [Bacteroidota bacterium]